MVNEGWTVSCLDLEKEEMKKSFTVVSTTNSLNPIREILHTHAKGGVNG